MNNRAPDPNRLDPLTDPSREYDENGVDVTLIRWMLSLTPTQRLRVLENHVAAILRLRGGRTS